MAVQAKKLNLPSRVGVRNGNDGSPLPSLPGTPSTTISSTPSSPSASSSSALSPLSGSSPSLKRASLPPVTQKSRSLSKATLSRASLKTVTADGFMPSRRQLGRLGSSVELRGAAQVLQPSASVASLTASRSGLFKVSDFAATFSSRDSPGDLEKELDVNGEHGPSEDPYAARDAFFEKRGGEAIWVLKNLRLGSIAAFQFASRSCYGFCHASASRKLILPIFSFQRAFADHVDTASIHTLFMDDVNPSSFQQNEDFASFLEASCSVTELYAARNPSIDPKRLARALEHLSHLEVFDISHSQLAAEGRKAVVRLQRLHPFFKALPGRLRVLDLSYNLLEDEHACALVTALEASAQATDSACLEELLLRSNNLGNGAGHVFGQFMQSQAASRLWRLDMRTNRVEADGACAMLTALQVHPRMKEMRVGYNRQNTKEDLETAKLASLLLQKALSTRSKNQLELLDLNNVRIGDTGMRRIAVALHQNTQLLRLDLAFNSIGPEGAESLALALESNYTLRELDLRDNEMADQGAEVLSKGLLQNSGLRRLQIARNGIGRIGALALLAAVRENEQLQVEFGASGDGSSKLQGMLSRMPSMADLRELREAEREADIREEQRGQEHMTLMFS
eukprot:TRINITY_DN32838_c0_g1_i1.p1 TRINITY_DN32838_c0_g1~~TRINITY_DN32838_c0_g1_i1.p1  ORF type:complete len:624 (-),score=120.29 TRINITY_DN32838_c0_g1_i1:19-1890(-)